MGKYKEYLLAEKSIELINDMIKTQLNEANSESAINVFKDFINSAENMSDKDKEKYIKEYIGLIKKADLKGAMELIAKIL